MQARPYISVIVSDHAIYMRSDVRDDKSLCYDGNCL